MNCAHKTADDHMRPINGERVWTCTGCGREGAWTDEHEFFGSYECHACWRPIVDRVWCGQCEGKRS